MVFKADLLQDHQIYCLQVCMCELFSPEMLQAGAVKGLRTEVTRHIYQVGLCQVSKATLRTALTEVT